MKRFSYLLMALAASFMLFSCTQDTIPQKETVVDALEKQLIENIEQNVNSLKLGKTLTAVDIQNMTDMDQKFQLTIEQEKTVDKDDYQVSQRHCNGTRHYFRAEHFYTEQDLEDPRAAFSGICADEGFPYLNVQKGAGNIYRMGEFSTELTFCLKPPGPGDNQVLYKDGQGTFFMEDGHELHYTISKGVVHFIFEPGPYQARFNDYLSFAGGTGPYENASGYAVTNSFVRFFPGGGDRTDHTWYGWLVLEN